MSNISMVEAKLPPGFRFHPRDEELVCDYLMKKVTDQSDYSSLLIEVDLNKNEPWDIPESACVGGKEWYFYNQRDRKYATGVRKNRATASGYWKATGKDRAVHRKGRLVGMRKTLVFYQGRAPKGKKSDWVMHEFRLESPLNKQLVSSHKEDDWVLCRVFYKKRVEVATTQGLVSCYDNNGESKSLPALMDSSSYIDFDHHFHQYEQVPCFSIFPQNQTNFPIFKQNMTQLMDSNLPNKNISIATMPSLGGGMPNVESNFPNDNEVLKAVLNQLTKMERNPTSKGSTSIEGSSESYLSEVGMPNMWSHY